jgi:hypothetical protein
LEGLDDENENKSKEAHLFLTEIFPVDLVEKAKTFLVNNSEYLHQELEESQHESTFSLKKVKLTVLFQIFLAIQKYLLAMDALNGWIEIIANSSMST